MRFHGRTAVGSHSAWWVLTVATAAGLLLGCPMVRDASAQQAEGSKEEDDHYVTRYAVWGKSTTDPHERAWSESYASRSDAEKRLQQLQRDYASGGLLEHAPEKPVGLYVKQIRVRVFGAPQSPPPRADSSQPRPPSARPGEYSGGVSRDNERVFEPEQWWESPAEQPAGSNLLSAPSGSVLREENGTILLGQQPSNRSIGEQQKATSADRQAEEPLPAASKLFVVWETTPDGKNRLHLVTTNEAEARLAKRVFELAGILGSGGRVYLREFQSWNNATVFLANQFQQITPVEKTWVDVKPRSSRHAEVREHSRPVSESSTPAKPRRAPQHVPASFDVEQPPDFPASEFAGTYTTITPTGYTNTYTFGADGSLRVEFRSPSGHTDSYSGTWRYIPRKWCVEGYRHGQGSTAWITCYVLPRNGKWCFTSAENRDTVWKTLHQGTGKP